MEGKWSFMAAFCSTLAGLIQLCNPNDEMDGWGDQKPSLKVIPPSFQKPPISPKKLREALALLMAVAHVDQRAFKHLLTHYCSIRLGRVGDEHFEQEIPPRILVEFDLNRLHPRKAALKKDMVALCGVEQREHPSAEYLEALKKIEELGSYSKLSAGKEIIVPVRFWFKDEQAITLRNLRDDGVDRDEAESRLEEIRCEGEEELEIMMTQVLQFEETVRACLRARLIRTSHRG